MRLKVPRFRLRLRTLAALVAVLAVSLWAGLSMEPDSPPGSPPDGRSAGLRPPGGRIVPGARDPALGSRPGCQPAIGIDDPSPRFANTPGSAWPNSGSSERAIPKLIAVLGDEDRYVRFSAAGTLGFVVAVGRRGEAKPSRRSLAPSTTRVPMSACQPRGRWSDWARPRERPGSSSRPLAGWTPIFAIGRGRSYAARTTRAPSSPCSPRRYASRMAGARRGTPDLAGDRLSRSGEIDPQFRPRRR